MVHLTVASDGNNDSDLIAETKVEEPKAIDLTIAVSHVERSGHGEINDV